MNGGTAGATTSYRFAPIPEDLLVDTEVDPLCVRVYGVLMRHGLDPSACFPSHARIAEWIGTSPRSVQRPLRDLERRGWIERVPRFSGAGERLTDGFHVQVERAEERAHRANERGLPRAEERVPPAPDSAQEREQVNESQGTRTTALARRECDEVFEALAEACSLDWQHDLTDSARGALNKAAAELRRIGAAPAEIRRRALVYSDQYGEDKLTPPALVKHWPAMAKARAPRPTERERRVNGAKAAFLAQEGNA